LEEDEVFFTEEEIQEISEDDEDFGHLRTKKYVGSLSSKQLVKRIEEDPNNEAYPQTADTVTNLTITFFVVLGITGIGVITTIFSGNISSVDLFAFIFLMGVFFGLFFLCGGCFYALQVRTEKMLVSSEGVGIKWKYGDEAIAWQHIAYLHIWWSKGKISKVKFAGNRRRFWHRNPWFGKRFSLEILKRYLPDVDNWEVIRKEDWHEGVYRYTRPDDSDAEEGI